MGVSEPAPTGRQLTRLTEPQAVSCQSLIAGDVALPAAPSMSSWPQGQAIRLEQKRLSFGWVQQALNRFVF